MFLVSFKPVFWRGVAVCIYVKMLRVANFRLWEGTEVSEHKLIIDIYSCTHWVLAL